MELSPKQILRDLVITSGAMKTLLLSADGETLAEAGATDWVETGALAAAVGSLYTAARAMAKEMGDNDPGLLLQQGAGYTLMVCLASNEQLLAIFFNDAHQLGRIRLEARKALNKLGGRQNRPLKVGQGDNHPPLTDFREYALSALDKLFE